jgi:hypothetical protein
VKQLRRLVHRTILVFDVEGFGDLRRSAPSQRAIREGMYSALQQAFGDLGVSWQACEHEDRGDGLFVLVPPDTEKGLFAEAFPLKLTAALHAHNDTHKPEEAFRLRMALHAGEVQFDDHGVTAPALNHTFRLVNATPFKSALKNSSGVLAIIASSWFYSEVIRNSEEYRPGSYRPVLIREKETRTTGWIALPGHPRVPGKSEAPETWRVRIVDPDGHVHGAGVLLHGRYVITAANAVAQSLKASPNGYRPRGPVWFDLPAQPRMSVRAAEIVWWPAAGTRAAGLAGLSVVGPAIRGTGCPPLRGAGQASARIVRAHRSLPEQEGAGEVKAWGVVEPYSADSGSRITLGPLSAESGPHISHEFGGADVVDAETKEVLGIVAGAPSPGDGATAGMVPVPSIATQWPLLDRIITAAEVDAGGAASGGRPAGLSQWPHRNGSGRPHWLAHNDFLRLIEHSLQVPELATAQSRHTIVTELPLEVALGTPRSCIDRADVAGLLWTCTETQANLDKLRRQVRRKARAGNGRAELLKDLEKLLLS